MAHIIAIANQKGGVGKTTSAVNLGASLAVAEQRVLAIDMDPQGNLSSGLGYPKTAVKEHVYHVLTQQCSIPEVTLETEIGFLKLIPTQTDLIGAEIELVDAEERQLRLSRALAEISNHYDYILIDCPPSLGLLTLNALVAADTVLVPLQCEYYALEGLGHLLATIERVRRTFNAQLTLEGILLCMYDKRMNLTKQVAQEVREHFPDKVFDTVIPRNVRLGEAPSFGKPALLYDIDSAGARGYLELAQELILRRNSQTPRPRRLKRSRSRTTRRRR
jgi:chromosome partitioning protein